MNKKIIYKNILYNNQIDNYKYYAVQKGYGLTPDVELYNGIKYKNTLSKQTLEKIINNKI